MTRRTDNSLRNAINVLEAMHLSQPDGEVVLARATAELIELLGVDYGYAYYCSTQEGSALWNLCGVFQRGDGGVLLPREHYTTSYDMAPKWVQRLRSGRAIINNTPDDAPDFQPSNHPPIANSLCLPIMDARYLHGVIVLCNSKEGFDQNIGERLRPFLAATTCLLRVVSLHAQQHTIPATVDAKPQMDATPQFVNKLLDSMFNAVLLIGEQDQILQANTMAASLFGLGRNEFVGESLSRFLPKNSPQIRGRLASKAFFHDIISNSDKLVFRGIEAITAEGDKRLVDVQCLEVPVATGFLRGLVFNDISERLQSNADYLATLQRFQVLTTLAPVGIVQLNRNWQCTYANDTWCEYAQITLDESMGVGWLNAVHKEDLEPALNALRNATAYTGRFERDFRLQSPLGKITWVKANACSLYDEMGDTSGVIMTFNDISEHRDSEARLRKMAETDQLTGLVNRTFFYDRVEQAVSGSARYGSVALMFIDLDEFKHVNDTMGHDMGDKLLQDVALRLRNEIRDVDTLARLGGDEFTVLLTHIKNAHVVSGIADKLIEALQKPFLLGDRAVYVTCSIGIAVTKVKEDSKLLMKQADIALYRAKGLGRNQYKFYSPAMDRDADLHIQLKESLQRRDRQDFSLVYQPVVDGKNYEIIGLEALTRWQHPESGDVSPDRFIKMIEDSGLMQEFSDWLLNAVFEQIHLWNESGVSQKVPSVAINLSAKQLRDKRLPEYILTLAARHEIYPGQVVFEVTETALIDDSQMAIDILSRLREAGFGVSLDDFGIGFSSLSHLREMPITAVKIDRSFISDVLIDPEDEKIVAAIIELTKVLELRTVAEGVEAKEIRRWLLDRGCTEHQGFYYHRPMVAGDIERLVDCPPMCTWPQAL